MRKDTMLYGLQGAESPFSKLLFSTCLCKELQLASKASLWLVMPDLLFIIIILQYFCIISSLIMSSYDETDVKWLNDFKWSLIDWLIWQLDCSTIPLIWCCTSLKSLFTVHSLPDVGFGHTRCDPRSSTIGCSCLWLLPRYEDERSKERGWQG